MGIRNNSDRVKPSTRTRSTTSSEKREEKENHNISVGPIESSSMSTAIVADHGGGSSSTKSSLKKFFKRGGGKSSSHAEKQQQQKADPTVVSSRDKMTTDTSPGAEQPSSLAASRSQRQTKKNKRGGLLSGLLHHKKKEAAPEEPPSIPANLTAASHATNGTAAEGGHLVIQSMSSGLYSSATRPMHNTATSPAAAAASSSKNKLDLFQWQDEMEEQERRSILQQKQLIKERDGFCRRVDHYDGQVIHVEGKPAYELGNYLGGGVAGVVYEGHRLQPIDEYPVRSGAYDRSALDAAAQQHHHPAVVNTSANKDAGGGDDNSIASFLCMPEKASLDLLVQDDGRLQDRDASLLTMDSQSLTGTTADGASSLLSGSPQRTTQQQLELSEDIALEATRSGANLVLIDRVDAPSRSKHFAQAVKQNAVTNNAQNSNNCDSSLQFPSDASFTGGGIMEETVAVKILNPVGFRTLAPSATQTAVVARPGDALEPGVMEGTRPMEERHVWWLVNPSSRNLRTLQRYNVGGPRTVEVDRGSAEKGLRISLVASYKDPATGQLKELPLTRCIEIWGHVPFGASDEEFKHVMDSIDRINQGQPPPPEPAFLTKPGAAGRVGTETTGETTVTGSSSGPAPIPMDGTSKRTGIYRAAFTERQTVFCQELNAYIAIPATPSKYLKWLRQRRAATKEIRNMMRIGRHRNVVHLFEVLELIQENKSTMFLILELVRGGELFDLISSNAAKISEKDKIPEGFSESETVMRKFFQELASGVNYCHENGIAHRDLKPENLLVHNSRSGDCVLKIADFGLSAVFSNSSTSSSGVGDQETVIESVISVDGTYATSRRQDSNMESTSSLGASPIKESMDKLFSASGNALSFLTCGTVDTLISCAPSMGSSANGGPSPLKRMTSVVGSPHYVAPEIISQSDSRRNKNKDKNAAAGDKNSPTAAASKQKGYDGTKADVWSAGVILYAMLFRSLPFGEDLLRCPRFQSYRKWYDGVRKIGSNRRTSVLGALDPVITDQDQRDFLGPHWFFPSSSSRESRDLIVYMLNPDPDMRPTIEHVLRHPWLLKEA